MTWLDRQLIAFWKTPLPEVFRQLPRRADEPAQTMLDFLHMAVEESEDILQFQNASAPFKEEEAKQIRQAYDAAAASLKRGRFSQKTLALFRDLPGRLSGLSVFHEEEGDSFARLRTEARRRFETESNAAQRAVWSKDPLTLMRAFFTADLGAPTSRDGKVVSFDHYKMGKKIALEIEENGKKTDEIIAKLGKQDCLDGLLKAADSYSAIEDRCRLFREGLALFNKGLAKALTPCVTCLRPDAPNVIPLRAPTPSVQRAS